MAVDLSSTNLNTYVNRTRVLVSYGSYTFETFKHANLIVLIPKHDVISFKVLREIMNLFSVYGYQLINVDGYNGLNLVFTCKECD